MSQAKPLGTHVIICDWHGVIKWIGGELSQLRPGETLWKYASEDSVKCLKQAFSAVVALQEKAVVEVMGVRGRYSRLWMWPLQSQDMAVCILGMIIPKQLQRLSPKEREALDLMAQGETPKQIADLLEISLSSVHTHLRRAREKLNLQSTDALLAFAARYCQAGWEADAAPTLDLDQPPSTLRAL